MDPLSITAGVISLLAASVKAGLALKDFYDGINLVDMKVKGVLTEVDGFTQVLKLVKSSLEEEEIQSSLHSTGHIGKHWDSLSISIRDGLEVLKQLQVTIEKANKSVRLLDAPRKYLRLKGAADEIAVYQQQIRSYKDAMQLSLQIMVLSNTVSLGESSRAIVPNLEELHRFIQQIAVDFNSQISGLQHTVVSNSRDHNRRLGALINLRNYARSAATVASSASTTLDTDLSDRLSDFGDCFPPEQGEAMRRWISSNTVHEFEEEKSISPSSSRPKSLSGNTLQGHEESEKSGHSDSDDDLESEIIRSLLRRGRKSLDSEEFEAAERHLCNCLTRLSANNSSIPSQDNLDNKLEVMKLLISTYRHQEKWDEARSLLTEKLALGPRSLSEVNKDVLPDTLTLVEILLKKAEYAEALLYGRQALRGYKKLGSTGTSGVDKSLVLLCQICKAAGSYDDEDAYASLLSDFRQSQQAVSDPFADEESASIEQKPRQNSPVQQAVGQHDWNAIFAEMSTEPSNPSRDPDSNSEYQRPAEPHDWDAIFAELPIKPSSPSKDPHSSFEYQRPAEPGGWDEIFAGMDVPISDALRSEIHVNDDPILKKVIEMGFPRADSLNALEKCDYNLEQTISYLKGLTSKSIEKQGTHDWDAIFASLDTPDPDAHSAETPQANTHIHDDPILKSLTKMGFPRNDALIALERYDYNIEKAGRSIPSKERIGHRSQGYEGLFG